MHPVIYDVAVSLDGFLSGPDQDISKFSLTGPVVDDYMARLLNYKIAIMGRMTYEFGCKYGLTPGDNPYKHMKTYVVSSKLECTSDSEITVLPTLAELNLPHLKQISDGADFA